MGDIEVERAPIGYALQAASGNTNISDAATLYFGLSSGQAAGSVNNQRIYFPKAGVVRAVYLFFANTGTLSTNETATVSFRLNNTTDTTISSAVTHDAAQTAYSATTLNIAVAANDYFEIKYVAPTFSTNPTNVRMSATIYIN